MSRPYAPATRSVAAVRRARARLVAPPRLALALPLLAALPAAGGAQGRTDAAPAVEPAERMSAPRQVRWVDGFIRWPLPEGPGARGAAAAVAEGVLDALQRAPSVTAPPDTVCVGVGATMVGESRPVAPWPGTAVQTKVVIVVPQREPGAARCGEGYWIGVHVNRPEVLVYDQMKVGGTDGGALLDEGGPMFLAPHEVGTVGGGHTRWYAHDRWWVVLSRRPESPTLPVSAERYLRAWLAANERSRAELGEQWRDAVPAVKVESEAEIRAFVDEMRTAALKSADDLERNGFGEQARRMRADLEKNLQQMAEVRRTVAATQREVKAEIPARAVEEERVLRGLHERVTAQLASLTPAQRAADACWATNGLPLTLLASCDGNEWAQRVVTPNPAFMDASAPGHRPQLIVVETRASAMPGENPGLRAWRLRVFDELDYDALLALMR